MRIEEITKKNLWERFIEKFSPQSLFQSWNWGETIKIKNEKLKMKNLWRLGIYDNNIVGIAQIQKVIARRGTFFHLRHGPIFREWERKTFQFFLEYLKDKAKEEKVSFIRISPLIENSVENNSFFADFGFINAPIHRMDGEVCWVLDITFDEATLLSGMRKTTRYLIRQAEKIGVEIKKTTNVGDLNDFFRLYEETAARHGFVKHIGILEEFTELSKDNQILLFKGYYKQQLLASSLIVFYNHQAVYHHSASFETKIPVNYLLQWEAIREAKKRGKTIYNFWGIAPEGGRRHPWRGLTIFKKGFGGKIVEYLHAKDLPLSPLYCATYLIEWGRKIWKGY